MISNLRGSTLGGAGLRRDLGRRPLACATGHDRRRRHARGGRARRPAAASAADADVVRRPGVGHRARATGGFPGSAPRKQLRSSAGSPGPG